MEGTDVVFERTEAIERFPSPRDFGDVDWAETPHWYGVGTPSRQVSQGWKLYVSATPANYISLILNAAPVFLRHGIAFKYLRSIDHLCQANIGLFGFSQVGKNLVAYLETPESSAEALTALRQWLGVSGHFGPVVPRLQQLWRGIPAFLRYGAYRGTTLSIDGRDVVDDRDDPKAVIDVLDQDALWDVVRHREAPPSRHDSPSLLARYPVRSVICRSGKGGVFIATDVRSGDECIAKLGLRHGAELPDGRDGAHFVRHEARMYALMTARGMGTHLPHVIEFSDEADASILLLERLSGEDLFAARSSLSSDVSWVDKAVDIISKAHFAGFVLGDVKLSNFVVTGSSLRLIDLESCQDVCSDRKEDVPVSFRAFGVDDIDRFTADSMHFLLSVLFVDGAKESLRANRIVDLNELLASPPRRDAWDEFALAALKRLMGAMTPGFTSFGRKPLPSSSEG